MVRLCALLWLALGAQIAVAQSSARTYINPLDIDYRYNFEQLNRGVSYRSSADAVIQLHRGEYYLFATIAGGYWRSRNLGTWTFVQPSRWPFSDIVAPGVLVVRDTIYLLQSTYAPRPLLYITEPRTGRIEFYNRLLPWLPNARAREDERIAPTDSVPPGPWDPQFFHDPDTEKWYLYWGSSNVYPLYGIELDKQKRLVYMGRPTPLIRLHPEEHGWERFGWDHRDTVIRPYIEGAWVTKHAGRYYLQYGAPGTEHNVYATGTYVGDHPLGPFQYANYNPVSYKPGGFVTGTGHGNTFQDAYGNWWSTGTPWIGYNWTFERRLALFPAGFDGDGQLFANTRFGDFPHYLPTRTWQSKDELFTGWMLLSYRKPVTVSSVRDTFQAGAVTDENPRTFWVADQNRAGETVTIDLGAIRTVRAVQVNYADYQSNLFINDSTVYTEFTMLHSPDGRGWHPLTETGRARRDRPNAYLELPAPVRTRYIRYQHGYVAAANLAISDIRIFGNADGGPPRTPAELRVRRAADPRNAFISWKPVNGAVGYNILWGIRPDKLYQTYQVFADRPQPLELRALTLGQEYYFAVEAFNESGVSRPGRVVRVR